VRTVFSTGRRPANRDSESRGERNRWLSLVTESSLMLSSARRWCLIFAALSVMVVASGCSREWGRSAWHQAVKIDTKNVPKLQVVIAREDVASGLPRCVAFSPDGTMVAVGGGYLERRELSAKAGTISVWDTASGARRHTLSTSQMIVSCGFAADSRTLAASDRFGYVHMWRLEPLREISIPADALGRVSSSSFSPDGSLLVIGGTVIDLVARRELRQVLRTGEVQAEGVFSPDGALLAVRLTSEIRVFETGSWGQKIIIPISTGGPAEGFFINKNALLIVDDKSLTSYDLKKWRKSQQLKRDGWFADVAALRGPNILFVASTGSLASWCVASGARLSRHCLPERDILAVAASPNGYAVATVDADPVRVDPKPTLRLWGVSARSRQD